MFFAGQLHWRFQKAKTKMLHASAFESENSISPIFGNDDKNSGPSAALISADLLAVLQVEQLRSLSESEPNCSVDASKTEFGLTSRLVRQFSSGLSSELQLLSVISDIQSGHCNSPDGSGKRSEAGNSDGLVICHISHREAKISVFAGMASIKVTQAAGGGGGRRGAVSLFTRAARKRMLERLAKTRNMGKSVFVTLTYPSVYPDEPRMWKRHLDTFFKRLRRFNPNAHAVWRIEPQKRGAPHFHLLIFQHVGTLLRFRKWTQLAWFTVVGSGDEKHFRAGTQVDRVYDRRHAIAYAAKYAAKPSSGGRRFITLDGVVHEHVGKHWGIFNAAAADCEPFGEFTLSPLEVIELRRMMVRFLHSKHSRFAKRLAGGVVGFSVFGLGDDNETTKTGQRRTVMRMLLALSDV